MEAKVARKKKTSVHRVRRRQPKTLKNLTSAIYDASRVTYLREESPKSIALPS